ncbi:MAG: gamma-glutamylcyclotransferase family protein [Planctomycetota bacterium]
MSLVFAYGCLMDPAVMQAVCPGAVASAPAADPAWAAGSLIGWKLAFPVENDPDWGGAVAAVRRAEGERVEGVLWSVDAAGLARLDDYEDVESQVYRRERLPVARQLGNAHWPHSVLPWVYLTFRADEHVADSRPSPAYLASLRRGAAYFGLSDRYRRMLDELSHADGSSP